MTVTVALETSTRKPSVALDSGEGRVERQLAGERPHASDLLPVLDELMRETGLSPDRIDVVGVGIGPGSYTGLRVGIATALGLARGSGAKIVGVPSGEALAWCELERGKRGSYVIDARQGELYFARYARTDDDVEILHAPCVVTRDELLELLDENEPLFGDEAAQSAANLARELVDRKPHAAGVLEIAQRRARGGAAADDHAVEPLYLRGFRPGGRK